MAFPRQHRVGAPLDRPPPRPAPVAPGVMGRTSLETKNGAACSPVCGGAERQPGARPKPKQTCRPCSAPLLALVMVLAAALRRLAERRAAATECPSSV